MKFWIKYMTVHVYIYIYIYNIYTHCIYWVAVRPLLSSELPYDRFNVVLEKFLRDLGSYLYDSITVAADLTAEHPWCEFPVPPCPTDTDCGGHLSKVNSLSCSRNRLRWFELCDMVRSSVESEYTDEYKVSTLCHKGLDVIRSKTQVGWYLIIIIILIVITHYMYIVLF